MATTMQFNVIGNSSSATRAMDQVGSKAQQTAGKVKDAFKGMALAAGAAAGVGVVMFLKGAISQASDLNETMSKSKVIFGENAKGVATWASGAARSMGMSKQAALESAASFGDMFSQIGIAGTQAAKMSEQVVQMSADLGSFNNLPTADVVDMISGAFRGEYDSLQRVIPNISAARVQTEALSLAHKTNANDLTAAEKAQATMNIVMKDGARAQGDFGRTSSGLANSQKILAANVQDLQAKVGSALIPVLAAGTQFLTSTVIPAFTGLYEWVGRNKTMVLTITGVVGGMWAAYKGYQILSSVVQWFSLLSARYAQWVAQLSYGNAAQRAASTGLQNVSGSISKTTATLGFAAAGVALVTYAWKIHRDEVAKAKARVQEMTQALEQDNGAVGDNTNKLIANKLASSGAYDAAAKYGLSIDTVTAAAHGSQPALDAVARATKGNMKAMQDVVAPILKNRDALAGAAKNYEQMKDATNDAGRASDSFKVVTQGTTRTVADQNKSIDALSKAIDTMSNKTIDAKQQELRLKDAFAELTAKVKDNGTSLNENTDKGRSNKEAFLGLISQVNDYAVSVGKQTGSSDAATAALARGEAGLRKTAIAAGYNKGEVDKLIRTYGVVPNDLRTTIRANTGPAKAAIDDLVNYIKRLSRITLTVKTPQGARNATQLFDIRSNAQGTGFFPGGWTRMNELGGEMAYLPGGSKIIPASQTAGHSIGAVDDRPIQVTMVLDGQVLHQSLLRRKRETSQPLGLA